MTSSSKLEEIYAAVEHNQIQEATDILFDEVESFLEYENLQFDDLNEFIKQIDVDRLDTNLLVAALSITKRPGHHLPYRQEFAQKCKDRLQLLAPERLDRLIDRLM